MILYLFFIQVKTGANNPIIDPIISGLKFVKDGAKHPNITLKESAMRDSRPNQHFDLAALVKKSISKAYFSYLGSLTTPPCTENVRWLLFEYPIVISESQVVCPPKVSYIAP